MYRSAGGVRLVCVVFAAGVLAGALLSNGWPFRRITEAAGHAKPTPNGWLTGGTQEKFAQVEKHLRGLDVCMAEVGYRYGELIIAARTRNWDYAKYQTEKIDLSLTLAVQRRPKRAKSARPFLDKDVAAVLLAVKKKDPARLDQAMAALHDGCVQCHKAEEVLYFKEAVDRIRRRSLAAAE